MRPGEGTEISVQTETHKGIHREGEGSVRNYGSIKRWNTGRKQGSIKEKELLVEKGVPEDLGRAGAQEQKQGLDKRVGDPPSLMGPASHLCARRAPGCLEGPCSPLFSPKWAQNS